MLLDVVLLVDSFLPLLLVLALRLPRLVDVRRGYRTALAGCDRSSYSPGSPRSFPHRLSRGP